MERFFNKIETEVEIEVSKTVEVRVTDEQLAKGCYEAVEESPSAFADKLGDEAILKMASVLWGKNPTAFMGELIAYASNPNSVAGVSGDFDLN